MSDSDEYSKTVQLMKIFFDTEFTGLHKNTTLISIGLVAEDGKYFYAEFTDYDPNQLNSWLIEHVLSNLRFKPSLSESYSRPGVFYNSDGCIEMKGDKTFIVKKLSEWFRQFKEIEMWSDCLSYDWVLFCDLYEDAFGIPENIYYIPFDICTLFKVRGIDPDIQREAFAGLSLENSRKHNAEWDARVIAACYMKMYKL